MFIDDDWKRIREANEKSLSECTAEDIQNLGKIFEVEVQYGAPYSSYLHQLLQGNATDMVVTSLASVLISATEDIDTVLNLLTKTREKVIELGNELSR